MSGVSQRARVLDDLLHERVLVLDGAMGTMLQRAGLQPEDFGGAPFEGCHEQLTRTRPDAVRAVHDGYLRAGADIITTNTFGANRLVLAEYALAGDTAALNIAAAALARTAADEWPAADAPRLVAGAIGPTNRSISVTGGVTFTELVEVFYEQACALVEGGVDLLLLETCQDTRNTKAALLALDRLSSRVGPVPVMVSATIEASGTMLAGQSIEAFCASVAHAQIVSIGLNCAIGPEHMAPHLEALAARAPRPVSCHPNAGLPDAEGCYDQSPRVMAAHLGRFLDRGWLNIVGGCCGTTEAHIGAIAAAAAAARPRPRPAGGHRVSYAGVDLLDLADAPRPLLVGERANVVGSRAFNRLIANRQWDEAVDVALEQVRHGARIIDVCLQSADRNECDDIAAFYDRLTRVVRAPIMVDTTDVQALELALTYCQGKSLVNSANLEDGGQRLEQVCQVVRRHGAALVLGCIDNDAHQPQALSRERKLAVAERAYAVATAVHGLRGEDVIIDPLVFPAATGDPAYIGSAVETIEAIPLIKRALPGASTVLGISNVSFGLPAAARRVVDAVFLDHCARAGLDLAIANAATLVPVDAIADGERRLAENLLFNRPLADADDALLRDAASDWRQQPAEVRVALARRHIAAVTEHFRAPAAPPAPSAPALSIDERIARCIVDGTRTGLIDDLDSKRAAGMAPLDIINGPLMAGMNQVARLFKDNKLIVAEVLRSAEVMRAGVRHLEQFIAAADVKTRGTVLLATVRGDVHDIGKDLVKIILANNGYSVVDLGTRVAPGVLIEACRTHRPTAVGLSGLLVKSAHQMVATADALRDAGIAVPLLVGGAALSAQFTRTRIAPAYAGPVHYAADAMAGLELMNAVVALPVPCAAEEAVPQPPRGQAPPVPGAPAPEATDQETKPAAPRRRAAVTRQLSIPTAPYYDRRIDRPDIDDVWQYLNPFMLFNRHLGFKGDLRARLASNDPRARDLVDTVEQVKADARHVIAATALWQFFEAEADGDVLRLFEHGGTSPVHSFALERQRGGTEACLSDYVLDPVDGRRDHVVLFVATAGAGVRERSAACYAAGEFVKAHALQALALETAEGCAEWLHKRIRAEWGFPDPPSLSMQDLFTSRYRGKRYSFGYPACPDLENQRGLFTLLRPEEVGVTLTDGLMMDPEASVSGLVFHHPDCDYFAVESRDEREARA